jgi:hypothetical protein
MLLWMAMDSAVQGCHGGEDGRLVVVFFLIFNDMLLLLVCGRRGKDSGNEATGLPLRLGRRLSVAWTKKLQ